jgi:hypothetical protein|tara:strand:- start:1372 stop:1557 length:186 start_codon:yes stop_codon:yes gene_type:complete
MDTEKEQRRAQIALQKQVSEMRALVDTLQTALRRAENVLVGHEKYDYVFPQSAKWAMNEKL